MTTYTNDDLRSAVKVLAECTGATVATWAKRPLAAKLCAIMADIKRVPKHGFNKFHNYSYVTDEDVVDAVRPIYAKHGVAWFPTITKHTRTEHTSGKGTKSWLTEINLHVKFVDPESGDTEESDWPGTAIDADDKGLYKAMTGALKYALLFAPMASAGDNPEQDSNEEKAQTSEPTDNTPRWQKMLAAFASIGIGRAQVEARFGAKADALTPGQVDEASALYANISRNPKAAAEIFQKAESAAAKVLASL